MNTTATETLADVVTQNPHSLVSQCELAVLLKCDVRSIRRMVKRKELPAPAKMGKKRVWTVGKVQKYIDERQDQQTEQVACEFTRILKLRGI